MTIKLKIDNQDELFKMAYELKKAGLLKDVSFGVFTLPAEAFPFEVPVDMDSFIKLMENPMVRPFKKRIDQVFTANIMKVRSSLV